MEQKETHSYGVTLTSIEASNVKTIEERWGFAVNEDMQIFIAEAIEEMPIVVLSSNCNATAPKLTEAKSIGKLHLAEHVYWIRK